MSSVREELIKNNCQAIYHHISSLDTSQANWLQKQNFGAWLVTNCGVESSQAKHAREKRVSEAVLFTLNAMHDQMIEEHPTFYIKESSGWLSSSHQVTYEDIADKVINSPLYEYHYVQLAADKVRATFNFLKCSATEDSLLSTV